MSDLEARVTGEAGNELRLVLDGDVDLATIGVLRCALDGTEVVGPAAVVLDMSRVTFFGSSGVNAVLAAQRSLREHGSWLEIERPSRPVRLVLDVLGLHEVIPIRGWS